MKPWSLSVTSWGIILEEAIFSITKGDSKVLNIDMKVEGDKLILVVDLGKSFGPSKSGKTIIVASTQGNKAVTSDLMVGLNVYKYPEK